MLVRLKDSQTRLRSKSEELAQRLPGIIKALGGVRAETAVFDGILVALDENGKPSEEALEKELEPGGANVVLYLFDVLYAEEWDLRRVALRERKAVLRALLPESRKLFLVDAVAERGEALARAAFESGLPAIVAKKSASLYRAGASDDWKLIPAAAQSVRAAKPSVLCNRTRPPAITITNPRKVYWPEQGYTKGDLAAYYDSAAGWILPYLKDRPLHLYRWPDGIRGKSFYQKQLPEDILNQVETVDVARKGEEPVFYAMCNNRGALLTLINTGSIDLHPWMSRKGSLDSPDWAFIDLDPKEASFSDVVRIARAVGKLLRGLGIEPYLKTSGSTGLHVCIPLASGYTFEQSRMFCEAVARLVVPRARGHLPRWSAP